MYGSTTGREMQQPLISSQSNNVAEYEELMKGSVHCPTCRGTGKVPKDLPGVEHHAPSQEPEQDNSQLLKKIDTQVFAKIRAELKEMKISQETFAAVSSGRTQGYLSDLLRRGEAGNMPDTKTTIQNLLRIQEFLDKPVEERLRLYLEYKMESKDQRRMRREYFEPTTPVQCRGDYKDENGKQEAKLIALIPVTDTRLNPQIKSKVAVAVVACIVIAALIIFFLIPRSVSLSSSGYKIKPYYGFVNTSGSGLVILHFTNSFNVTNDNYYPVTVSAARMSALHDEKKMATAMNISELNIPLRSTVLHHINMNITFSDDEGYVADFCSRHAWMSQIIIEFEIYCGRSAWMSQLVIEFDISVNSTYLGHTEQDTITTFQHVNCSSTSPKRRRRSAVSQTLHELGVFS